MSDYAMNNYYDRDGKPIDMKGWAYLHATDEYRRVAEDTIGPYWISTVWLGIDHSWGESNPLIFETMVFPVADGERDMLEIDMERYSTEEEAIAGHARFVTLINATFAESLDEASTEGEA